MNFKISQNDTNSRLDAFLSSHLNLSRSKIAQAISDGTIKVNSKIQKPSYKLKFEDEISYNENILFAASDFSLKPYDFKLDIVYEDEYLIVVNKPKGILTHPTKFEREKTISNALLNHCKNLSDLSGQDRLGIVHRLDKNTAGLMIAAKDNSTHKSLSEQIKTKELKRKYLAIALREFEEQEGVIDKPLVHYLKDDVKMAIAKEGEGLEAITKYQIKETYKGAALVELELKTGRTHQIRVHLSSINHPIFGDSLYGAKSFMRNEFYNLKVQEQLLQSYYIEFTHPKSLDRMSFELKEEQFAPDFIKVLNFLRRKNNGNFS